MIKKIIDMLYNITAGCAVVTLLGIEKNAIYVTFGVFFITLLTHYFYNKYNKGE